MKQICTVVLLLSLLGCDSTTSDIDPKDETPKIGEEYGGGIVLSVQSNKTIWIVSKSNQHESIEITCPRNHADGEMSANSQLNTSNLSKGCPGNTTGASLVWNLSLNGYDDWYIPGRQLLKAIYDSKELINIDDAKYWSSSCKTDRCSAEFFWVDFSNGSNGFSYMDSTYKVRAVRKDTLIPTN